MKLGGATVAAGLLAASLALAEAVRNGNELALAFSRADAAGRASLAKASAGRLYTFRFLTVTAIDTNRPGAVPVFTTTEPSSDFIVLLQPQPASVTRGVAASVAVGDALAASGRLLRLDSTNTLVIEHAVLRSKDRAAPKGEKELLPEIDPRAVK